MKNAVIQVKTGRKTHNLLKQLQIAEKKTCLVSIGYAPDLPYNAIKSLRDAGALVTQNINELLEVIKP